MLWGPVEESDEQKKGFREWICYGSWVGRRVLLKYWEHKYYEGSKGVPTQVGALKGITGHPDEPWHFWAYLKRVIKVAVISLYQFLKVKRWEYRVSDIVRQGR
jgi:hypothetical protein